MPFLNSKNGFSLVELSIVLVILGLLVGGVMTGQNLIKAAELRSVTSEFQQWQTAVNIFKDKYFQLPGDFNNATAFWTAEANCAAVESNSHLDPLDGGTCDGDGNGLVGNNNVSAGRYEHFLFWHHLQMAGLVPGTYTGVRGSVSSYSHVLGENAPRSKYNNGGWTAWSEDSSASSTRFNVDYGNGFIIGGQLSSTLAHGALFTPEEAWNIDTKVDDGMPGLGSVVAWYWGTCADGDDEEDFEAIYQLSDESPRCALSFIKSM